MVIYAPSGRIKSTRDAKSKILEAARNLESYFNVDKTNKNKEAKYFKIGIRAS